jgi:hypothetical protein
VSERILLTVVSPLPENEDSSTVDSSGRSGWLYLLFLLSMLGVGLYGWRLSLLR